jgi:hypothetical protein
VRPPRTPPPGCCRRPLAVAIGRETDRDAIRAPDFDQPLGHFAQQAHAVFRAAAVIVVAQVRRIAQELVDQVAIGGMELHAVEPGELGVLRGAGIVVEQAGHLVDAQRAGNDRVLAAFIGMDMARNAGGRGRDRRLAIVEIGMDHAAHVPELGDHAAPGLVERLGHRLPPFDLLCGPQARRIRPAKAFAADAGGFGNDQPGAGALGIVLGHDRRGHAIAPGAATGEGRHQDAVGGRDGAKRERLEQGIECGRVCHDCPRWERVAEERRKMRCQLQLKWAHCPRSGKPPAEKLLMAVENKT